MKKKHPFQPDLVDFARENLPQIYLKLRKKGSTEISGMLRVDDSPRHRRFSWFEHVDVPATGTIVPREQIFSHYHWKVALVPLGGNMRLRLK